MLRPLGTDSPALVEGLPIVSGTPFTSVKSVPVTVKALAWLATPLMALLAEGNETDPALPNRSVAVMLPALWLTAPEVPSPRLFVLIVAVSAMPPVPA